MTAIWLDHKLFGDGRGMMSPYHDNRFYWLVDTSEDRSKRRGDLYTFFPGFGAQLRSFQWRHPKPGETRRLIGLDFKPFTSLRHPLGRVEVSWATHLRGDHDAQRAELDRIRRVLTSTLLDPNTQ